MIAYLWELLQYCLILTLPHPLSLLNALHLICCFLFSLCCFSLPIYPPRDMPSHWFSVVLWFLSPSFYSLIDSSLSLPQSPQHHGSIYNTLIAYYIIVRQWNSTSSGLCAIQMLCLCVNEYGVVDLIHPKFALKVLWSQKSISHPVFVTAYSSHEHYICGSEPNRRRADVMLLSLSCWVAPGQDWKRSTRPLFK